jgi:hypothetical protein
MPLPKNIFEAIESGDARRIIAVVDPMFKKAAREASARAHAEGVEVCDGRARDEATPKLAARAPRSKHE